VSSWHDRTDAECALREHLHRDDDVCLGLIVRYRDGGPTYAWWRPAFGGATRIGACSSDQTACAAVECVLEQGGRFMRLAGIPFSA
jgi:hypothetical protein